MNGSGRPDHLEFGAEGERLAARFLARRGWRVLARNVRIGRDELDIVAMDGDELVVVEVRARRIGRIMPSETSVGPQKIKKIVRAARKYVDRSGYDGFWRIDVVAVTEDEHGAQSVELFSDITMGMEGGYLG